LSPSFNITRSEFVTAVSRAVGRVNTLLCRYKEQLIKQLVKTGHEAEQMNKQYNAQLRALEEEKSAALHELSSLQKALDEAIARERNDKQQTQQLQM